jgi:HrpA-like RNA helicase
MTRLPLDPKLSAALLAAEAGGCTEELLTVAAMLSVQSIWAGGRDSRKAADAAKLL